MAINRYQGNSGRVQRIPERSDPPAPQPVRQTAEFNHPRPVQPMQPAQCTRPPRLQNGGSRGGLGFLGPLGGGLEKRFGGVFSKLTHLELETEDLILLLILYLMYRESRDEDLLLIMGLMLFL